eukprot:Rmarinus@m.17253
MPLNRKEDHVSAATPERYMATASYPGEVLLGSHPIAGQSDPHAPTSPPLLPAKTTGSPSFEKSTLFSTLKKAIMSPAMSEDSDVVKGSPSASGTSDLLKDFATVMGADTPAVQTLLTSRPSSRAPSAPSSRPTSQVSVTRAANAANAANAAVVVGSSSHLADTSSPPNAAACSVRGSGASSALASNVQDKDLASSAEGHDAVTGMPLQHDASRVPQDGGLVQFSSVGLRRSSLRNPLSRPQSCSPTPPLAASMDARHLQFAQSSNEGSGPDLTPVVPITETDIIGDERRVSGQCTPSLPGGAHGEAEKTAKRSTSQSPQSQADFSRRFRRPSEISVRSATPSDEASENDSPVRVRKASPQTHHHSAHRLSHHSDQHAHQQKHGHLPGNESENVHHCTQDTGIPHCHIDHHNRSHHRQSERDCQHHPHPPQHPGHTYPGALRPQRLPPTRSPEDGDSRAPSRRMSPQGSTPEPSHSRRHSVANSLSGAEAKAMRRRRKSLAAYGIVDEAESVVTSRRSSIVNIDDVSGDKLDRESTRRLSLISAYHWSMGDEGNETNAQADQFVDHHPSLLQLEVNDAPSTTHLSSQDSGESDAESPGPLANQWSTSKIYPSHLTAAANNSSHAPRVMRDLQDSVLVKVQRRREMEMASRYDKNDPMRMNRIEWDRQHQERIRTEVPAAVTCATLEEAIRVVDTTVKYYARELGGKNPVTVKAADHLRLLQERVSDMQSPCPAT